MIERDPALLIPKIMPLVKSDGTMLLTKRTLDESYLNQLGQFLSDISASRKLINRCVKSIIIDDVKFD